MRKFFERKVVKNTSFLLFLAFLFILLGSSNCTLQEDTECTIEIPTSYTLQIPKRIDTINVSLLELTDKAFVLEISANPISSQLDYELIDETLTPVLSDSFGLTEGHAVLRFSGLSPSKEYLLRFKKDENTILEIPFKTFGSIGFLEGYRFFNFIDLTDVDTSHVRVTIFGQFNSASNIVFNRYTCHHSPDIGMTFAKIPEVSFYKKYGNAKFNVSKNGYQIYINPGESRGYFKIEYAADKSKIVQGISVWGHLSDRYFLATHEQFMLFPEINVKDQVKSFELSTITPFGWKLNTWWKSSKLGVLYVPESKLPKNNEGELRASIAASHFYAYDPRYFNEYRQKVADTNILVIKEKSILQPLEEYTFKIYQRYVDMWGSDIDYRNLDYRDYVVMLVSDSDPVCAGEYTDSQGFSIALDFGKFISHQFFHRWNGWACAIGIELKQGEHPGFWLEGFNEYYNNKVLTELGLTKPNQYMKERYYKYYKSIYGTSKDVAVVYFNESKHGHLVPYDKGAVIVYYMDKKLREITNGKYSMDDVLKYFLKGWKERNQPFSYERMLKYLEQIGGSEYAEEVRQIIYENKRVVLPEFE